MEKKLVKIGKAAELLGTTPGTLRNEFLFVLDVGIKMTEISMPQRISEIMLYIR